MNILIGLINNATLLISLAMLQSFILKWVESGSRKRELYSGLVFGAATILGIFMSVQVMPGIVFDGRSIVLSMAGLFGGPGVAGVAAIMAAGYRVLLGGDGVGMGIAVIVITSALGVAGYFLRKSSRLKLGWASLYLLGVVVHLSVLASVLALPPDVRWQVFGAIAAPMMLVFPVATVLFGLLLLLLLVENSAQSVRMLRASHSRLVEAEANAHIGHWWLEPETLNAYWADEIYRILGADPSLPAGPDTLRHFVHPDDWGDLHASLMCAFEEDSRHRQQYRIMRPGGEVRWVDCHGRAVRNEKGEILHAIGTFQDVTDRVQAEDAARAAEQRLDKAQAVGHVGSWEYELASGKLWGSDEGFRIYGIELPPSHEFPIDEIEACIPERERVHQALVDLIESDKSYDLEFAIKLHGQAAEKYISSVAEVVRDPQGAPIKVIGVIKDITQRKKAELALREAHANLERQVAERTAELAAANEHLQELDRLKSLFIASMSHELRTPLNSIIGFTGMLLQEIPGPVNDKQLDYLTRVAGSSQHLLALIGDVIDIAKVGAGKAQAYVENFDLGELVNEAAEQIRVQAEKKGLSLTVAVPPGVVIASDRRRLMQCLLNYLSNALKYTRQGGITLRVSGQDAGELDIAVIDTGVGIAPADQEHLFRQFSRIDSEITRRTSGTGLGLYLTRKLATEVLGGRVSMDSKPGEGSTFRLHLPREVKL